MHTSFESVRIELAGASAEIEQVVGRFDKLLQAPDESRDRIPLYDIRIEALPKCTNRGQPAVRRVHVHC